MTGSAGRDPGETRRLVPVRVRERRGMRGDVQSCTSGRIGRSALMTRERKCQSNRPKTLSFASINFLGRNVDHLVDFFFLTAFTMARFSSRALYRDAAKLDSG